MNWSSLSFAWKVSPIPFLALIALLLVLLWVQPSYYQNANVQGLNFTDGPVFTAGRSDVAQDLNHYARLQLDESQHWSLIYTCEQSINFSHILNQTAMDDGTVVVTFFTQGFLDIAELFFARMRMGEDTFWFLNHLVVITFNPGDKKACCALHLHCYMDAKFNSTGKNFSGDIKTYQSDEYVALTWRKIEVKYEILQLGYNILFTDSDVMWLKNPLPHFSSDDDFITGCDVFHERYDCFQINTGFYFARNNNRTRAFYKLWINSKKSCYTPVCNDQDAFAVINPRVNEDTRKTIGLKLKLIGSHVFGSHCDTSITNMTQLVSYHSICSVGTNKYTVLCRFLAKYDWKRIISY